MRREPIHTSVSLSECACVSRSLTAKALLRMIRKYDESNPYELCLDSVEEAAKEEQAAVKLQATTRAEQVRQSGHAAREQLRRSVRAAVGGGHPPPQHSLAGRPR